MEKNIVCTADLTDCIYRLNCSDLIVGVHHSNKAGVAADGSCHLLWQDDTVFVNVQKRDFEAFFLQFMQGVQYRVMFKCRRYNMPLSISLPDACGGYNRLVAVLLIFVVAALSKYIFIALLSAFHTCQETCGALFSLRQA